MKLAREPLPSIRGIAALALLALAGALADPAHAVRGYDNFSNTPLARFSKEDSALMMTRVNQALQAEKDGETLDWKSEASPASGSVTPLARFTADGVACRRLRIVNVYGEVKAEGVYRFCERGAGKWKLVGPDAAPS